METQNRRGVIVKQGVIAQRNVFEIKGVEYLWKLKAAKSSPEGVRSNQTTYNSVPLIAPALVCWETRNNRWEQKNVPLGRSLRIPPDSKLINFLVFLNVNERQQGLEHYEEQVLAYLKVMYFFFQTLNLSHI